MTKHFQNDVPRDFSLDALDELHDWLTLRRSPRVTDVYGEWTTAASGIIHRLKACDEDCSSIVGSLHVGKFAPPADERYRQERDLFRFFFQAVSCMECVSYGMFFLGSWVLPAAFEPQIERNRVTPSEVVSRYRSHYPSESLTGELAEALNGSEFREMTAIRNVLSHRGSPGRSLIAGDDSGTGEWNLRVSDEQSTVFLDPDGLLRRREWIAVSVNTILGAALPFVQKHLP